MYDVHSGIKMNNHVEQGSTYSNCFSGGLPQHHIDTLFINSYLSFYLVFIYLFIIYNKMPA